MAKPSSHLDWAVGNPNPSQNIIEPSVAKKIAAWAADERPPYEFFNWIFYRQDEWNKYFEQQTDALASEYDLVIGSGGDATHATLQDAVDDGAVGANQRVLITEDYSVDAAITLTKARWRIDFSPGVVYSKGGGAPTKCLQLQAEGIVVNYGRFTGWTTGGDIVIEQNIDAEYCNIFGTRFGPGTDTEIDQSAVPAGKQGNVSNTISEV